MAFAWFGSGLIAAATWAVAAYPHTVGRDVVVSALNLLGGICTGISIGSIKKRGGES